jgi:hypothetical protein
VTLIFVLSLTSLFTALLSGVFGMAGGMLLMGVYAALLPVPTAMVMHGGTQLVANVTRAILLRKDVYWRGFAPYVLGALAAFATLRELDFVPDQLLVFLGLGLTPFVAALLPPRWCDIDATVWYPDCDADGFAPSGAQSVRRCTKPAAPSTACKAWTDRSPASSGTTDCNDVSVPHHPGASYDFPFTPATAPSAPAAYDLNCDGVPEIDPDRYVAFDLEGAGQRSVLGMCGSGTGCCIYGLSIVVSQCGAGGSADIDCGNFRAEQYPVMYRCR